MKLILIFVFTLIYFQESGGLNNGLALTPPMGWMSWERFRCNINCAEFPEECISEQLIKLAADFLVSEGYAKAGYNYVVLDDCWLAKKRDQHGNLQANSTRFPSGILDLAKYVHSKGLKFGIYEDYGTKTCAGFPGVINHMEKDVKRLIEWQVDYIKLDGCYADPKTMDEGYPKFQKLLNQTGRSIVYSCSWPSYQEEVGIQPNYTKIVENCNLWRNYLDIQDSWNSVRDIMDYFARRQNELAPLAGPGHWNDPDMLIIGNFGLSYEQAKTHMAIWCILAAPLFMSVDLRNVKQDYKEILQNRMAIEIDQDPLGIQGRLILLSHKIQVWRKPVTPVNNNYHSYAVAVVNRRSDGVPSTVTIRLRDLGLYNPEGYSVQDIFSGEIYNSKFETDATITVRVNPSGVVFLRFNVMPTVTPNMGKRGQEDIWTESFVFNGMPNASRWKQFWSNVKGFPRYLQLPRFQSKPFQSALARFDARTKYHPNLAHRSKPRLRTKPRFDPKVIFTSI